MRTYAVGADVRPHDALNISVARSRGFVVISPRTLGLGLRTTDHRVSASWLPSARYHLAADATLQSFTDGNRRWELTVSPRRSWLRTARFNVDVGASSYFLGTERNLDNGYYDPRLYQLHTAVAYPYWKISDDVGLAASIGGGLQRDSTEGALRFGGNAAAEATFGIYRAWMLKVSGAVTSNRRLETGAFRGYSTAATLTRRF
jgi:hypothetical protein